MQRCILTLITAALPAIPCCGAGGPLARRPQAALKSSRHSTPPIAKESHPLCSSTLLQVQEDLSPQASPGTGPTPVPATVGAAVAAAQAQQAAAVKGGGISAVPTAATTTTTTAPGTGTAPVHAVAGPMHGDKGQPAAGGRRQGEPGVEYRSGPEVCAANVGVQLANCLGLAYKGSRLVVEWRSGPEARWMFCNFLHLWSAQLCPLAFSLTRHGLPLAAGPGLEVTPRWPLALPTTPHRPA